MCYFARRFASILGSETIDVCSVPVFRKVFANLATKVMHVWMYTLRQRREAAAFEVVEGFQML